MSDINSPATPAAQDSPASARLEAGQTAPDFTLPSDEGDSITLSSLRGQNIILYFYPAAMTPGCTTEACDFRDNLARLSSRGFTVLGISKDPMDRLVRFRERDHLTFPLLLNTVLLISRLCMADLRTCPEISCLYMAGQSVKAVGRGHGKPHFRETDCHI